MGSKDKFCIDIDRKIENAANELGSLYISLGQYCFNQRESLRIPLGATNIKDIESAEEECTALALTLRENRELLSLFRARREELEELESEEEREKERIKALKTQFGALIYEKVVANVVKDPLLERVQLDIERENELLNRCNNSKLRLLIGLKQKWYKRGQLKRYDSYANLVIENSLFSLFENGSSLELVSVLKESLKRYEELKIAQKEANAYIIANEKAVKALNRGGLKLSERETEKAREHRSALYKGYGELLIEKVDNWIDSNTPSATLDIIENLVAKSEYLEKLKDEKDKLISQAKADYYKSIISEDRDRIRVLQKEKCKLDDQIRVIEKDIERLSGLVDELSKKR